jgi:hypothetical protein
LTDGSCRRARDARWQTRFGSWVDEIGVFRIVDALGHDPDLAVTSHAVYRWLSGNCAPNPRRARALVELSGGELTLEVIYDHTREMKRLDEGGTP